MSLFNRKKVSKDKVQLNDGSSFFLYELTNKILRKAETKSYGKDDINKAVFFATIEDEMVPISKSKFDNLSIKDANRVRTAVKKVLLEANIIDFKERVENNGEFDSAETEWFGKVGSSQVEQYKKKVLESGGR